MERSSLGQSPRADSICLGGERRRRDCGRDEVAAVVFTHSFTRVPQWAALGVRDRVGATGRHSRRSLDLSLDLQGANRAGHAIWSQRGLVVPQETQGTDGSEVRSRWG